MTQGPKSDKIPWKKITVKGQGQTENKWMKVTHWNLASLYFFSK